MLAPVTTATLPFGCRSTFHALLLVALDEISWSQGSGLLVEVGLSQRPPLVEEIPLVERDLEALGVAGGLDQPGRACDPSDLCGQQQAREKKLPNCRHFASSARATGLGHETGRRVGTGNTKCLFAGNLGSGSDGTRTRDLRRDRPAF